MEGRRAPAVAHLAYARSQKSGTGILGSKRVLQGGEKSSPLVVLCDLWLVYGVYGLGGEKWKCGPGREIMVLGQALVAGSMVQGAKPCPWVKPVPAKVWSREPNCGPGQARPRQSVVQGAKPCPRVKPSPAVVWSREQNRGPRVTPCPARAWSSHLKYKKESKTNI